MSEESSVAAAEAENRYYGQRLRELSERALANPEEFWAEVADNLVWFKRWEKVLEWNPPFARWFVGGVLNASYNCLDVNLKNGLKNKVRSSGRARRGPPEP